MANVVLKSDFRDGDLLFAQQLNNNFKAIQKALETMNSIIWQDNAEMVVTFRGTTEEINERDIIDGQILYDVLTGETYIDYDGKRISTGSGNAIHIGEDEPTNPSTQVWIESDEVGNMISEVVNTLDVDRTDKAPSVDAVNKALKSNVIWQNPKPTEDFESTTIPIDSSKYKKFYAIFRVRAEDATHFETYIPDKGIEMAAIGYAYEPTIAADVMVWRRVHVSPDSTYVYFGNAEAYGVATSTGYFASLNSLLIPYQIIGLV